MTLQFDPSAYAAIFNGKQNRDLERKKMLSDSLQQIPRSLIDYAQYQQGVKEQDSNQRYKNIDLALKAGEQGYDPNAFMSGLPGGKVMNSIQPNSGSPATGTPTAPPSMAPDQSAPDYSQFSMPSGQPMIPGQGQLASAGVGDVPDPMASRSTVQPLPGAGQNGGSPLVAKWNSLPPNHPFGPQSSPPANPGQPQSMFQRPNVDYTGAIGAAKSGDYSKMFNLPPKQQGDALKAYEMDQNREDRVSRDKQTQAYRDEELALRKQQLSVTAGEKSDQFNQKEWDKIVKEANPLTASTRTGLGMAARADYNANRALVTLSKPVVTNQEAGNVMADIAQIYQGGSPTEYGMSHQGYNTLYQKIAGSMQYLTGKPQDALPDQIKQRLIGVIQEMKSTNGAVLKQHLDSIERSQPKVISKYQDEWKNLRGGFDGGIAGGPPAQSGLMWNGRPLKDTPANRAWLAAQQGGGQ